MKILKWLGILLAVYLVFVVVFETFILGLMQPELDSTGLPMLVLTTTDESGASRDRRLARFEMNGKIYGSKPTNYWKKETSKKPSHSMTRRWIITIKQ